MLGAACFARGSNFCESACVYAGNIFQLRN
jgi:hypothetical protein